ncbi:ATP-dependent RNA helicase DHX30 [Trichonephila clavata]|uniref:ATP-dependent RNA helicase DHX30 n=1 Tax=Trichonephila clavata TaxID=2740835 RepID=A0A8X6HTK0_TRICU|nr:ATP-dependent RNA helicase DHX30 [Trichonephila clavata]
MRRIVPFIYLRNFLNSYPKCSNCTFTSLLQRYNKSSCRKLYLFHSRLLSSISSVPNIDPDVKQLFEEFPDPKKILWKLINEAYVIDKNPDVKPVVTVRQIECKETKQKLWKVSVYMRWPECFHVEGISSKKNEAENLCFLHACQKLKGYNLLDKDNKPSILEKQTTFTKDTIKSAKGILLNLFQRIWIRHGKNMEYMPKFEIIKEEGVFGKDSLWKCILKLSYPEKQIFETYAVRSREAESVAAAKALHWLKEKAFINEKNRLIQYSPEEENRLLKYQTAPYSICIPSSLQDKMTSVLLKLQERAKDEENVSENISVNESIDYDLNEVEVHDIFTDDVYCELTEEENIIRSKEMLEKRISFFESNEFNIQEIKKIQSNLPIADKRTDILRMIEENQVVVLSGETGCGKTTQVPQYILDHYIGKSKGATCNIVVTQPRRISAITVAERVAHERNEQVGETVGYHVRLNKNMPKQKGAILYCSTGMLLRKLCSNPNLEGVSHVIVDEVHERNIQIDFLLILLKRLLESNKQIKIIIMSASFNTSIFSHYFNNCPVLHVPGKIYPVKEFFLEDLPRTIRGTIENIKNRPVLNVDLIAKVINYVHTSQKSGAILCFLPGWHDIMSVKSKLLEICKDPLEMKLCCAHSRLPHEEQKVIFDHVPNGIRKIILATNIAETSITIDDVVYVVNSGLHKGTSFDGELGIASLGTHWITKANVRQRRGRAGRVQNGVCYNLFTRKNHLDMDDYPVPELLRMPLESVILDCKLYHPHSKAEDFLSTAIQPPSQTSLHAGVNELQMSGVLDENENLTELGKVIVNFPTHPRLSIALVYASFLGCLDPILTVCSILTLGKEPFINTLEEKSTVKFIKQQYDNYLFSDHLALSKIFDAWLKLKESSETEEFVNKNLLDESNLYYIKELKALFAESLFSAGIIDTKEAFSDPDNNCNINSNHANSIFAALSVAFYPNVMKVIQGEISHGKLNKEAITYSLIKGQRGYIQKESVAANEHELPSPWLAYFLALQSEARRLMMTSAVSPIPGICLLLFGGQKLSIVDKETSDDGDSKNVTLMLDDYKKLTFSCSEKEAELLLLCRNYLRNIFRTYIRTLQNQNSNLELKSACSDEFLAVLKEIISTPQVPFTKGQFYKFVNNELISEDL